MAIVKDCTNHLQSLHGCHYLHLRRNRYDKRRNKNRDGRAERNTNTRDVGICGRSRNGVGKSMIAQIEYRARTEARTKDRDYNEGAKLIRERGYEAVKDAVDVVYWCMCNGF